MLLKYWERKLMTDLTAEILLEYLGQMKARVPRVNLMVEYILENKTLFYPQSMEIDKDFARKLLEAILYRPDIAKASSIYKGLSGQSVEFNGPEIKNSRKPYPEVVGVPLEIILSAVEKPEIQKELAEMCARVEEEARRTHYKPEAKKQEQQPKQAEDKPRREYKLLYEESELTPELKEDLERQGYKKAADNSLYDGSRQTYYYKPVPNESSEHSIPKYMCFEEFVRWGANPELNPTDGIDIEYNLPNGRRAGWEIVSKDLADRETRMMEKIKDYQEDLFGITFFVTNRDTYWKLKKKFPNLDVVERKNALKRISELLRK